MEKNLNFNQIHNEFSNDLLNYVNIKVRNIEVSKDICSDIFIKVYKHLQVFDSSKAQFKTWLFTIANNTVIDYWRKEKINKNLTVYVNDYVSEEGKEFFELPETEKDSSCEMENKELNSKIELAMCNLTPKLREVAELVLLKQNKYEEVANLLDIPLSTVKVYVMRAKELLQKELKKEYAQLA